MPSLKPNGLRPAMQSWNPCGSMSRLHNPTFARRNFSKHGRGLKGWRMNSELLKSERFVYFEKTPSPGIRYIRAMFAPPNTRPGSLMLASKFIYGWTLDSKGTVIRAMFAECASGPDGLPDGCGDYHPSTLKDCEAG